MSKLKENIDQTKRNQYAENLEEMKVLLKNQGDIQKKITKKSYFMSLDFI